VLATTCSIHFVHDGFSDILYVLLPLWANDFRLTFAQVGMIRTAYSGGMAAFQIPAGLLAERWGERRLLAAGTAVTALGFIAVGAVGGFLALLSVLLVAGIVASILGAVQVYRTRGEDFAGWGVVVLGIALVIVSLN